MPVRVLQKFCPKLQQEEGSSALECPIAKGTTCGWGAEDWAEEAAAIRGEEDDDDFAATLKLCFTECYPDAIQISNVVTECRKLFSMLQFTRTDW